MFDQINKSIKFLVHFQGGKWALKQITELRLHHPDLFDLQYIETVRSSSGTGLKITGAALVVLFVLILACLCC